MPFGIRTEEGAPACIKIASLPPESHPYVAFASTELAQRFLRFWSIRDCEIVAVSSEFPSDRARNLVIFETHAQLEAYEDAPEEYPLETLLVPFSLAWVIDGWKH